MTGRTTTWQTGTDLATGGSKRAKHQEVSMAERNEAVEMDRGSRSALIVAPESRETDPRKPVSSQGGASVLRNCHWETRDELRVIQKRVNATVADSNGPQNRKTEEPDARNGRIRICGGAFGGIRGATRQRHPSRRRRAPAIYFVSLLIRLRFALGR